jgi:hypothetical protein
MKKSEILSELFNKQLKKIPIEKKLSYSDLERLVKYIDNSIFDKNKCCLWTGYVTNSNVKKKVKYVNFYFRKKKTALHRMLYINFVKYFDSDGYITFSCDNKGKCCNVNHMIYHEYTKKPDNLNNENNENNENNNSDETSDEDLNSDSDESINQDIYTLDIN